MIGIFTFANENCISGGTVLTTYISAQSEKIARNRQR